MREASPPPNGAIDRNCGTIMQVLQRSICKNLHYSSYRPRQPPLTLIVRVNCTQMGSHSSLPRASVVPRFSTCGMVLDASRRNRMVTISGTSPGPRGIWLTDTPPG